MDGFFRSRLYAACGQYHQEVSILFKWYLSLKCCALVAEDIIAYRKLNPTKPTFDGTNMYSAWWEEESFRVMTIRERLCILGVILLDTCIGKASTAAKAYSLLLSQRI